MSHLHLEDYELIKEIALRDVETLKEKGKKYGSSWRKYGGVSAFMNTQRKADRFEEICKQYGYDVFKALDGESDKGETLLDTIADLRAYLLLVEAHYRKTQQPYDAMQDQGHSIKVGKDGRLKDVLVAEPRMATRQSDGHWRVDDERGKLLDRGSRTGTSFAEDPPSDTVVADGQGYATVDKHGVWTPGQ